jgi:hypothetical protein
MDPVAESQWLYRWPGMDLPEESPADPSFRQLQETLRREGLAFQRQSADTQRFLEEEAVRIAAALMEAKGEIRFRLPEAVLWLEKRKPEPAAVGITMEIRGQKVCGLLNRLPLKDNRSAFRRRLSQLENSGYSAVRLAAGLLRYAVVRHIVHDLAPDGNDRGETVRAPEAVQKESSAGSDTCAEDAQESEFIRAAEGTIVRLRRGLATLHQAVSLAPYMYADDEYQSKRNALLSRLVSQGHTLANLQGRRVVRKIWRRALAGGLDRGLSLSLPYFDDQSLDMKLYGFEVIPPGRTMFVPAFVALAAAREQEKIVQQNLFHPSTRVRLLAELKSLEQAFDGRPE